MKWITRERPNASPARAGREAQLLIYEIKQ